MKMPNDLIRDICETGHAKDSEDKEIFVARTSVWANEGMAIYNLIRKTKAKSTLEIGLAYGLSALFACQAHADNDNGGRHTAIDPNQSEIFKSIGILNNERAGLQDNFQFYEAPSFEVLPQLLSESDQFDFIFIDGHHVFDYTLVDFFFSDLILKPFGHIMFDDLWMPSVRKVAVYVLRNRQYQLAPQWIWEPQPLMHRVWRSLSQTFIHPTQARRKRRNLMVKHQLLRPFDLSLFYFALKGSLRYQVFQKKAEDDRGWSHHREF